MDILGGRILAGYQYVGGVLENHTQRHHRFPLRASQQQAGDINAVLRLTACDGIYDRLARFGLDHVHFEPGIPVLARRINIQI